MFYYISFLRPPPLQATDPIRITPQISNDLRTEFYDGHVDIYYVWSLHAPSSTPTTTRPAKLTAWRAGTAYKVIPVPPPPRIHTSSDSGGLSWRLILACGTAPADQSILLGETDTTGSAPFPVMSLPIAFPRGHKHTTKNLTSKQEQIVRPYTLCVPSRAHPVTFHITEQTAFDLDKKVWDSGIGLSSWLVGLFSRRDTASALHAPLFSPEARHILELGAGTGIVAVTLAILRASLDVSDPGSIVTTDLASAIPILQDNITANHALMHTCVPRAAVLDWEDALLSVEVQVQVMAGLDVIVMADVTYNTTSFPALIGTLARLIELSQRTRNSRPRVLMGYKERHPDERSLWDRAKEIGLHFQQVGQVNGASGHPVEIWFA